MPGSDDSKILIPIFHRFPYDRTNRRMEIVDSICESAEPVDDNGTIEADAQPVITSVSIRTD